MKEMKFWFESRVSNIYVSNELSRLCLYYDLKEYRLEPDFEKLDLT
jgi:hypothetical protein